MKVEKFLFPKAPIHAAAAVVVLAGMLWHFVGPGSKNRTVSFATLDRIDADSATAAAYFLAPRFPTECTATDSSDLTLRVVGDAVRLKKLHPGTTGRLKLRLGQRGCEFEDFEPAKR